MQNIGRPHGQEPFGRAASIDFDKLEIEGYGPFRYTPSSLYFFTSLRSPLLNTDSQQLLNRRVHYNSEASQGGCVQQP